MPRLTSWCIGILQISTRNNAIFSTPKGIHRCRRYASHKEHPTSSLLAQHFEQQRNARASDSVGPFQLGMVPPSQAKVKKWSELSKGGKVLRSTARTTNLAVILFGAGLSAVLVYAIASELFARNSPTVLYNDACERIKASPAVNAHLRAPLVFYNNPPLTHRPRHRTRHVNSLLTVDSAGREHLLLNFYIQANDHPSASPPEPESRPWTERTSGWVNDKTTTLSNLTYDDAAKWVKGSTSHLWQETRGVFAYLTGEPLPPTPPPPPPKREFERRTLAEPGTWTLTGIFRRLTGRPPTDINRRNHVSPNTWTTGEVHADLVKDEKGQFIYRYLLVNLPDSNTRNPLRIFVERAEGVHENESVLRWSSQ